MYPPIQMRLPSLLHRRLAALLAAVALVSVTARPVLACDMGHEGHRATEQVEAADPHAHHGPVADAPGPDAADDGRAAGPQGTSAPTSPACDHVVGCAVMVLSTNQGIAGTPVTVLDAAPRTTDAGVDAPAPAVEPPPPRR